MLQFQHVYSADEHAYWGYVLVESDLQSSRIFRIFADFIFIPKEVLLRKHDLMVQSVRQSSMPTSPHDRDNDRLTEDREFPTETGQSRARAQAEPNNAMSTDTLKHNREDSERCVLTNHDFICLGGTDAEGPEEDIPQVEA